MNQKPNKPTRVSSLNSSSISERASADDSNIPPSSPSSVPSCPAVTARRRRIVVETCFDEPETYTVSAGSPEEFVQATFDLLVSRLGDRRARKTWASAAKRDRGRPKIPTWNDAVVFPLLLKFEREMPGASATAIARACVEDLWNTNHKWGVSQAAAIKRLVPYLTFRQEHGFFPDPRSQWKKKSRI